MTENQRHQNLVKHVTELCQILNSNGIKDRNKDWQTGEYTYFDWRVDNEFPEATFMGGICNNREAFHFLKRRGDIDRHVCWMCGEQPIKNEFTFSDGRDASIAFFICKECYSKGEKLQQALRGNTSSSCFIATACYANENAFEVKVLRRFRDKQLLNTFFGFHFTKLYYLISPRIAKQLSDKPRLAKIIKRFILDKLVKTLIKTN